MDLEGTVAVVTGAAAGIGRATALALAHAGADVVVADIDAAGAKRTAEEIEAIGRRALPLVVDVTKRDQVEGLVERAVGWQGRCDLFMSNVGVGCVGAPHEYTPEQWQYLIDVNLWSCIWPLRLVIPHMLERNTGYLVFVTSGAGFEGTAERAPYNVAKFAIVGLAESCARALKGSGANVLLVVPGAIATEGWRRTVVAGGKSDDEIDRVRAEHRAHSTDWPRPEVMADAIVAGIRDDRYCVVQHNPYEPDWLESRLAHKGRDPDSFVLGDDAG